MKEISPMLAAHFKLNHVLLPSGFQPRESSAVYFKGYEEECKESSRLRTWLDGDLLILTHWLEGAAFLGGGG